MKKTKIAIIFPKDSEALFNKNSERTFGGASVQMYNIARELKSYKSFKTISLIPNYSEICFDENNFFNLVKAYSESNNLLKNFKDFFSTLNKVNPDIIIQHGLTLPSVFLAKYCNLRRKKFIYMFASDVEVEGLYQDSRKKNIFFKILLNNSYKLITQNKFQKKKLKELFGKDSFVLYNGFKFKKNSLKEKKHILWVGRCLKLKNPELFLEIAKENPKENFVMIAPKSSQEDYYLYILKKAKLIKNLTFIPFVDFFEIDKYFNQAKIFLNTSDYEGFSQTFIQASMNSTPIVSLNSDPDGFLEKNECGFFANGDINLMKNQFKKLLEDKDLAKRMSKNAYNFAQENHDISKNVKKLLEYIK